MNFRSIVLSHCGQVWQMESTRLADFFRQLDSLTALDKAGVRPGEDFNAAFDGTRRLQATIAADGTASIPIQGVILDNAPWYLALYGVDYTDPREAIALLAELATDKAVTSVVLDLDSGGGSHSGTEELAAAIAAFPKPIITHARGQMCSAALRIGAAADQVYASPSALVGSIGSYILLADTSKADAAAGIDYTLIASGGVKGHGADGRVTAELKAQCQQIVDQASAAFRAGLAQDRSMPLEAIAAIATGDVWFAAEAHSKGLIDGLLDVATDPITSPTTTNPPAASVASTPEDSMKISAAILASLISAFVIHAAFISERALAGDDEATIRNACQAKDAKAVSDARVAAEQALASEQAEHAKTKQALADEKKAHAALKKFAGNAPEDVGTDDANQETPTITRTEHDKQPLKYTAAIRAGKLKLIDG